MTQDGTDALEQALALHSAPGRSSMLRARQLPTDVLNVIRIAAGDRECLASAAERTGATQPTLVEASKLYLQRVLFDEASDSYRVLGVRSDADDDLIKLHHRWLVRWLHPDRAAERWEAVYTERVNRAWNTLSSVERRAKYDEESRQIVDTPGARSISKRQQRVERALRKKDLPAVLSPRMVRWIPAIVLGGLATFSVVALGLLYWVQHAAPPTDDDQQQIVAAAPANPAPTPSRPKAARTVVAQAPSLKSEAPITPAGNSNSETASDAGNQTDMDREIVAVRESVEHPSGPLTEAPDSSVPSSRHPSLLEPSPQTTASTAPYSHPRDGEEPLASHPREGGDPMARHPREGGDPLARHLREGGDPLARHPREGGDPATLPQSSTKATASILLERHPREGGDPSTLPQSSTKATASILPERHPRKGEDPLARHPREGGDPATLPQSSTKATASILPERHPRKGEDPLARHPREGGDPAPLPQSSTKATASILPERHPREGGDPATLLQSSTKATASTLPERHPREGGDPVTSTQPSPNGPTVPAVTEPASRSAPAPMSPQDGATFVTHSYVTAYEQGDLTHLLRLFAPNAINDRGGIDTISRDYAKFFHSSKTRTLHLSQLSWVYKPDRIVGTGNFDALVVGIDDAKPRDIRGWMRIEAVPVDGLWKIQSLQHGNP